MMAKKITDAVLNVRLGAIFRVAVERRIGREGVETLLSSRAGFTDEEAQRLACHWYGTAALRDISRLVVAARVVAFEDQSPEAIRELDRASEAFASIVPWDEEPQDRAA